LAACSGESSTQDPSAPAAPKAGSEPTASGDAISTPNDIIAAAEVLGRIDFKDGNTLTFSRMQNVLFIQERGLIQNGIHYQRSDRSAVEIFEKLAPDQEVPAKLRATAFEMFPPGSETLHAGSKLGQLSGDEPFREREAADGTGEFEQAGGALPWSAFEPTCNANFGTAGHNLTWKHHDRNFNSSSPAGKSTRGWVGVAANIGAVTANITVDGLGSSSADVLAGHFVDTDWRVAAVCPKNCCTLWICVDCRCLPPFKTTTSSVTNVASNENYHHCGFLN
jgi:hypothetical protein